MYSVNNVDLRLSEAAEHYLNAQINRRLSPTTISTYETILRIFLEHLAPDDPHPETVQPFILDRFFSRLSHLSDKRVLNYYIVLSAFWTWMEKREYVTRHVVHMVDVPKPGDGAIIPYTRDEVQAMLDATWDRPWIGVMLRALVLLLVGTGIRNSEACALLIKDYDEEHILVRKGKGKKSRRVYVPEPARDAIALYLSTRRNVQPEDPLFLNGLQMKLTRRRLYKMVEDLAEIAGVTDATVHKFRHYFSTEFLKNGGDIKYLKEILGHSDIRTTERYLYVNEEAVTRAAKKFNPLENLNV